MNNLFCNTVTDDFCVSLTEISNTREENQLHCWACFQYVVHEMDILDGLVLVPTNHFAKS